MGANRKLQAEIDRTLKKVAEGIEVFDQIWEKVYDIDNGQGLKEKHEADLKKEIKKLQRYRDQIKTWISGSDIKDKTQLLEARKAVERQMERFKVCEKETKTKAFSKEGLGQAAKLDPRERKRIQLEDWIGERLTRLNEDLEAFDAELEGLQAAGGKKKGKVPPRLTHLEESARRHRDHVSRLEAMLRLLANEGLDVEDPAIDDVKALLDDFLDRNQDDFDEFGDTEAVYEGIIVQLEGLESIVPAPVTHIKGKEGVSGKDKDKEKDRERERERERERAAAAAVKLQLSQQAGVNLKLEEDAAPAEKLPALPSARKPAAADATKVRAAVAAAADAQQPTAAAVSAVAAAAAAPGKTSSGTTPSLPDAELPSTPSAAGTEEGRPAKAGPPPSSAPHPTPRGPPSQPPAAAAAAAAAAAQTAPSPVAPTVHSSWGLNANGPAFSAVTASDSGKLEGRGTPPELPKPTGGAPHSSQPASPSARSSLTGAPSAGSMSHILGRSFEGGLAGPSSRDNDAVSIGRASVLGSIDGEQPGSTDPVEDARAADRAPSPVHLPAILHTAKNSALLTASYDRSIPTLTDSHWNPTPARVRGVPPSAWPESYPRTRPVAMDNPALFEKLDPEALFFAFYHQPATHQQYLAARELKRQSWRYHKQHGAWFQRHEEPKKTTDEYEQGTYVYFDPHIQNDEKHSGWCYRLKQDFIFKYDALEEELH